jgi:hypothetical protein
MEEIDESGSDRPKKGIKSEVIVATAAIVVSIMTLFVYIFQAQVMMEQQHTSVWPHVEWSTTYSSDTDQEFYISVVNKGVGPAIVKDTKLMLDGTLYEHKEYRDFMADLIGQGRRDSLWIMYSVVDNRVLAPGEEVKIFHVKNWQSARIPEIDYGRYTFTICYCSIYDDCWSTDGAVSTEGSCN